MEKKHINRIAKNKKITHCYIKKRGSYYRPSSSGYTDYQTRAGVYTKEEALSHYDHCDELIIVPIDINQHNALIIEEVKEYLSRIINL